MKALILALFATAAVAEPGPVVKYLMEEPVSMWDWGMYRMEESLEEDVDRRWGDVEDWMVIVSVNYTWKTNVLLVEEYLRKDNPSGDPTLKKLRELCRNEIGQLRSNLGFANIFGQLLDGPIWEHGSYGRYFQHTDFQSANEPTNLRQELVAITRLNVRASMGDEKVECEATPRGDIFFKDMEADQ